ncbi:hypothetical protein PoB_001064700 [Plakobranchus ocellatus]|uniref:Tyr recombinase domain-containing protein n=1 Tax=Plakobranchus ocellatus TaxID=259542 RepID=A0AAV3YPT5_9GAST|nr:hypothetical protein PoB_001064700 [Plakobranchus ocellatus]
MYKKKYGYSAINTARAAVSSLNDVGSHPLVCRFMRGVFNLRTSCPRYTYIWDVSLVLKYLRTLAPSTGLKLQSLSAKLATLCALVTGHRCQTFHVMDIKHMQISEGKAIFHIAPLLKTNSPKNPISTITLRAYREDRRICVFTCLKLYLKRTKHLRSTTQLFISNYSPHSAVTKDTLARWIKSMLNKAGIDTNVYKAHSTRAAASSAAARSIDIAQVLKTSGWSREQTFAKFYNKPIGFIQSPVILLLIRSATVKPATKFWANDFSEVAK